MKHVFSQLPQETALALKLLHEAGHEAVLVGGCVRDACMGIPPHDWDIATSARTARMGTLPLPPCRRKRRACFRPGRFSAMERSMAR